MILWKCFLQIILFEKCSKKVERNCTDDGIFFRKASAFFKKMNCCFYYILTFWRIYQINTMFCEKKVWRVYWNDLTASNGRFFRKEGKMFSKGRKLEIQTKFGSQLFSFIFQFLYCSHSPYLYVDIYNKQSKQDEILKTHNELQNY